LKTSLMTLGLATGLALAAAGAQAHFRLLEPASWIEENQLGDPQKISPCGGTLGDGGTRTGAVTEVTGGSMISLVVDETIYHPGHFRIALARRINWLPGEPPATLVETDRGMRSAPFAIEENPQPPVLLDGLWENFERRTGMLETEIRIPNIDCDGCFLQVVQFMADHPGYAEGGYTYYHCAVLNISADDSQPIESGW